MTPAQAIRTGLAKSFQFYGRASRPEFWWFALIMLPLVSFGLVLVHETGFSKGMYLAFFLRLVICSPVLAAAARRAIDAGFSESWVGWGLAGVLFAEGLNDIYRAAPSATDWMRPVAAVFYCISLAMLSYILTRRSRATSNLIRG